MERTNKLAPIVLFCFNRPWHTKQTLDALANNTLAKESDLIIYCDGPKVNSTVNDLNVINETREVARQENRFKSLTLIESEENKGLADSIIGGVTDIVNRFGKIIVLEDDIVTSPGFLQYMNDALDVYENEEKVMHISGYMFPVSKTLSETFFMKTTSCWGWATWRRAWQYFEKEVEKQIYEINQINGWKEFTFDYYNPSFKNQLELNLKGDLNTWAIFWYSSVFLKNGYSLHPYPSLVQNIGFDGSGIHCGKSDKDKSPYHWNQLAKFISVENKSNYNNKKGYNATKYFFKKVNKLNNRTLRDKFYIFRHGGYKKYFKTIFYSFFNPNKIKILNNSSQSELDIEVQRYVSGETLLFNKRIYFPDKPSFDFIYNEMFNLEIYKFISDNDSPLIIDCGANIGLSIVYFKQLYSNSRIIAFEPDPEVFKYLERNVRSLELTNVELHELALWTYEGEINFLHEGADSGRIELSSDQNESKMRLKCKTLSSILIEEVDFLKIDIEGAEFEVLNECKDKLHLVKRLFVEYHSMTNQTQNLSQLLEILNKNGFRYFISRIGINSAHPFISRNETLGMDNQLNIFAYK